MKKVNYQYVKSEFEKYNKILRTKEEDYINTRQKLLFICKNCNSESSSNLSSIRISKKCSNCAVASKKKYEEIEEYFLSHGCKLLTSEIEYKNVRTKVDYICKFGHLTKIRPTSFFGGQRCKKCSNERNSGENNHNYNKGFLFKGKLNPNYNHKLSNKERVL